MISFWFSEDRIICICLSYLLEIGIGKLILLLLKFGLFWMVLIELFSISVFFSLGTWLWKCIFYLFCLYRIHYFVQTNCTRGLVFVKEWYWTETRSSSCVWISRGSCFIYLNNLVIIGFSCVLQVYWLAYWLSLVFTMRDEFDECVDLLIILWILVAFSYLLFTHNLCFEEDAWSFSLGWSCYLSF